MNSITSQIQFIGADDDNIGIFEGQYPIPGGISYNSYFIEDEHIAVVDSVDVRRCGDWLASLKHRLGTSGRSPEYLIVQHMEPDHSGSVMALMESYPDVKIVCTQMAAGMLSNYFESVDFTDRLYIVKDGDTLSLGRITLRFITAPMVHWPEVMVTLDETDGVLFSADAFGTFAMSSGSTGDAWDAEARRYYTNIVGRFGANVQSLMKKIGGLKFGVVAPLHGPVLKENLAHYWQLYDKWSRYEPETRGVLVVYASIYGGTAEAARRIASELRSEDAGEVVLMDLCRHDVSYAVAEAFRLSHMVLCSVTYDCSLFPAMYEFLHHIECKKLSGRRVALVENGSWSPMAAKLMAESLSRMKDMEIIEPVLTVRSRLHQADIPQLQELVRNLMKK